MEYTIWIVPDRAVKNKASEIISLLSRRYKSPEFEPHITVLAIRDIEENEMVSKTSFLLKSLKPFEIRLSEIGHLDKFFQCIFVKAEKSGELMRLNNKAQELFLVKKDYMPHLSLMYGNFSVELKEEIIKNLGKDFDMKFIAKEIHLIKGESPDPKDWHAIKKFNL